MKKAMIVITALVLGSTAQAERVAKQDCVSFVDMAQASQKLFLYGYLEGSWSMAEEGTMLEYAIEDILANNLAKLDDYRSTVVRECYRRMDDPEANANAAAVATSVLANYTMYLFPEEFTE